jgi:hypothetical protein
MKIEPHHVTYPLFLKINLFDTPAMDKLWEYISSAKENSVDWKWDLAGHISSSLQLEDKDNWFFNNICLPTIYDHKAVFEESSGHFNQTLFKNDVNYIMHTFWVNFQKQHEFNPLHNHSGVFSFVVFMKIPYDWREQHEIPFVKNSHSPMAGDFSFTYTDINGQITSSHQLLDPSSEGLMLFFPAELSHQVYPFYNCEEERITISGNIIYDT